MRQPAIPLALASILLLAGCVTPPDEDVDAQSAALDLVDPLAALEAGEPAANLRLLGEWREGNTAEATSWGDYLYVMKSGTFVILDVSDPTNVTEVGSFDPAHGVLDVKVSDDGKYLFVGDDEEASGALGGAGLRMGGIYVYDVSDPASPSFVSYQPVGERRGPHMVFYHRMPDGRELVFGANADISVHEFDRASGTLTELARYSPDLVFGFNRDPQVVDVLYQGWAHDMFVMNEPDNTTLMYVANWDAGLRIVDVTDPAKPVELGGWNAFPDGHEGNLHTVSTAWIGERRISVGAVEVGFAVVGGYHYAMGTDASVVYVWDTTDPSDIQLLGVWENPMGEKAGRDQAVFGETITSTHNLQLEGGRVYLAHYGLGVWVLDVGAPETQAAPQVLAYYDEEGQNTWDVILHKGVLYTSGAEGVLGLHFAPDVLGEAGLTSRA